MFYCYALILLLPLVLLSTSGAQSTSESIDRWELPEAATSFEYSSDGTGLSFVFEIPVANDVASEDHIEISIYDKGCKYNDGDPNVELLKGTSSELVIPVLSSSSSAPMVTTSLTVELAVGEISITDLIEIYPTLWNDATNQLSFCVRFSLNSEDIEVNFIEQVVTLTIDLTAGVGIDDAQAKTKEKNQSTTRVSYTAMAYFCDGWYRPLNADKLPNANTEEEEKFTFRQGTDVRVCIRPDDAILGQLSIRSVHKLYFQQSRDPTVSQNAVDTSFSITTSMKNGVFMQMAVEEGSTDVSRGLSTMSCGTNRLQGNPDVVVCAVDTMLVAAFFAKQPGISLDVKVFGTVILGFGPSEEQGANRNRNRDLLRKHPVVRVEQPLLESEQLNRRQEVKLDKYWGIERAKFYANQWDFVMFYTLSDAISNDMVRLEVWKKSCEQVGEEFEMEFTPEVESSSDLLEIISTEASETGDGSGTQSVSVSGRWKRENQEFISLLKDSDYFFENSDGSLVQIALCLRYQVHSQQYEVNFLETPFIVNIDFKTGVGFSINLGVESSSGAIPRRAKNEARLAVVDASYTSSLAGFLWSKISSATGWE